MMNVTKRFVQHYYTNGKMEDCFNPTGFLLSEGVRKTKLRTEDVPPWFVPLTYWSTRYVDTSRVTDIVYKPCRLPHYNHLFKDDYLYLVYDGNKIVMNEHHIPESYYNTLWGWELVEGLFSAKEYSGIDIEPQLAELRAKILRYNEEYNEPWPDPNIPYDPDEIFDHAMKRVQERKDAYEALHPGTHYPGHPDHHP